jgi:hypothetical protein
MRPGSTGRRKQRRKRCKLYQADCSWPWSTWPSLTTWLRRCGEKPELDLWFLVYIALVTGFLISWFAGVNLFEDQIANALLGRILSGILVGGGSSLIHDVFDRPDQGEVIELEADFPALELTDVSTRIE